MPRLLLRSLPLASALLLLVGLGSARAAGGDASSTRVVGDLVPAVASDFGPAGGVAALARVGTTNTVQRISADGTLGSAFSAGTGTLRAITVQTDGKVLVAGDDGNMVVRRYLTSGALDTSFGSGGTVFLPAKTAYSVVQGPCGDIAVGGSALGADGSDRLALAHLQANGAIDSSFGTSGVKVLDYGRGSRANAVALLPDGRFVFAGQRAPGFQIVDGFVGRTNARGESDQGFGTGGTYYYDAQGGVNAVMNTVAVDAAGRLVAGGSDVRDSQVLAVVARIKTDGTLDPSFGSGGVLRTPASVNFTGETLGLRSLTLLNDGRIVGAGAFQNGGLRQAALYVVTANGGLDNSVNGTGIVLTSPGPSGGDSRSLAITGGGEIFAAGEARDFSSANTGFVTRYASLGAPATPAGCPPPPVPPAPPTPTTSTTTSTTPTQPTTTTTTTTSPPTTPSTPATVATTPDPPTPPAAPVTTPPATPTTSPPPAGPARLTKTALATSSITPRKGTVLTFTVSQKVTVVLTFEQRRSGRRSSTGRCAPTGRRGARCVTYVRVPGSRRILADVGANRTPIAVEPGRALAPGVYRIRVRAVGGNTRLIPLVVGSR
ncbi:MAG: uncharacterized protein JWM31_2833 [Solirubrobacterales bacterium]|nr:uncharacterized protein [Solirubrobacterales bacterium]